MTDACAVAEWSSWGPYNEPVWEDERGRWVRIGLELREADPIGGRPHFHLVARFLRETDVSVVFDWKLGSA